MDLSFLTDFLNNSVVAETTGGVLSTVIVDSIKKVKSFFKGKTVTETEFQSYIDTDEKFKEAITSLIENLLKECSTDKEFDEKLVQAKNYIDLRNCLILKPYWLTNIGFQKHHLAIRFQATR